MIAGLWLRSSSYKEKWKVKVKLVSRVWLFVTPIDCSLPGSSVRGIFQARVLEWVAISFSRGSSSPRDWTQASTLQADALPSESPGKFQSDWARKPLLNSLVKNYLNSKTRSYFSILNKWNFISHLIVMQVPTDVNLHRQIWQEVLPNFCDDVHWRLTLSKSQRRGFEHILMCLILDEFPSVLYRHSRVFFYPEVKKKIKCNSFHLFVPNFISRFKFWFLLCYSIVPADSAY